MKKLVVGILAHVDSGKTTLSEALLYRAGALATLGRVDHGDAFLDSFALERERGITIFSKQAILRQNDVEITLLDTPGHIDFSTEMERTLQVLDAAILVISGTDGVQSHTETLWKLLAQHQIPTFLFVNKMDLPGADRAALLTGLQKLNDGCVDFSAEHTAQDAFFEAAAACDEALLELFLAQHVLSDAALAAAVARRSVFPCYFGCALKTDGVDDLLAGLARFVQTPQRTADFGAKVFKISHDTQGNRLTHLKITGGTLCVKDTLAGADWTEKVNQIRLYSGAKFTAVEAVSAGSICAVTGLSQTVAGEGFGTECASAAPILEPVLTYRVLPAQGTDVRTALAALRVLQEEDPQLHVAWNERLQDIEVQLMGEVQLAILKEILAARFGLCVTFGQGNIVYKETIANTVEGVGHFEPLRHYAEVHLILSPGARGSGIRFASTCSEDVLDKNWQHLILTHLAEKTHLGVLTGSPVTDLVVTLASGKAHEKHTEGGDFRQATYRALRQGLRQAQSVLLEPQAAFTLTVPAENIGRAMSDFTRMSGTFAPPETCGDTATLSGSVSMAAVRDYQMELHAYTRGKGRLALTPSGYAPCHNAEEVMAALGYDCDGDVENTADSVFCEHGAGYTVKWSDVPRYMHLESALPAEKSAPAPQSFARTHRAAPSGSLAEDKELLAIYERTYGPVHRDVKTAFRAAPKEIIPENNAAAPLFKGTEYILVDGYNMIFAWDELAALAKENLDAARQSLIHRLCNYAGYHACELILVFDAYKVKGNVGEVEKIDNLSVVYTKEAETADMYIEKTTHALGQDRYVRVATSDGIEQMIILGHGALRVSARAFHAEVLAAEQAIRAYL
ncbi:MAG: TetM/TetW/TetO/TetS family tetracycline resistance ribosomal protection protein [Ruthenibacterium sp.]